MSRQSDIWEYLQGERTGKRANRFEREMLSDPFLYEAVEGLTTVKADHEKIQPATEKKPLPPSDINAQSYSLLLVDLFTNVSI